VTESSGAPRRRRPSVVAVPLRRSIIAGSRLRGGRPQRPSRKSTWRHRFRYLVKRWARWKGWARTPTTIGLLVLLAGLYFTSQTLITTQEQSRATQDQVRLAEQGQLTDRFGKAVEQLSSDRIEVRLGALYALEYLVHDANWYQPTAVDLLTAFVRTHAPSGPTCHQDQDRLPVDIQAALSVVGRRDPRTDGPNRVDLSDTCLANADLAKANLARADLTDANLTRANLKDANLAEANFFHADLTKATLARAHLNVAQFQETTLVRAYLGGADLTHAIIDGADLSYAVFSSEVTHRIDQPADLTRAYLRRANLHGAQLDHVKLKEADLTESDLTNAQLQGANLAGAFLSGAKVTGANLSGANLTNALGLK
jgi:uncharacterized protein YjbI with pentapeptide repeats